MQERRGEMLAAAQIPDIPNSIAMANISRLSLLLLGTSRRLKKYPQKKPRRMARRLKTSGIIISSALTPLDARPLAMADMTLKHKGKIPIQTEDKS